MSERRQPISPPQATRSFRERRMLHGKSLRALAHETGIHFARLSIIERGLIPSFAEHQAIEAALVRWETTP